VKDGHILRLKPSDQGSGRENEFWQIRKHRQACPRDVAEGLNSLLLPGVLLEKLAEAPFSGGLSGIHLAAG
jgi:hypothetical protein